MTRIRDGDIEKGGIRNGFLLLDKSFCSTCPSREYGLFHCTGSDSLSEVSEEKIRLSFKKKEMIFQAQEIVTGFYCIEKGLVRIILRYVWKIQSHVISPKKQFCG